MYLNKIKENKFKFSIIRVTDSSFLSLNEILGIAEEAKDLLECGSNKRLASSLDDITTTITKRQKIIYLADKSTAWWSTADKHLQDELASDLDDDKKMRHQVWSASIGEREKSTDKAHQFRLDSLIIAPSTRPLQTPVQQSAFTPVLQTSPLLPQYIYPQQSVIRPIT